MRRTAVLAIAAVLLSSCGTTSTLYNWGSTKNGASMYEDLSYQNYKRQTPESLCALLCIYEEMVTNPGGVRAVPAPGICAEFAYLLLQENTRAAFEEHATAAQKKILADKDFASYAMSLFEQEITNYPESAKFIRPLVEKFK